MTPPFLRYEFPRDRAARLSTTAEADARRLAQRWLEIAPRSLSVGRLDREAIAMELPGRLGFVNGDPLPGAERLSSWLTLVVAPGRVFLEVDLDAMAEESMR